MRVCEAFGGERDEREGSRRWRRRPRKQRARCAPSDWWPNQMPWRSRSFTSGRAESRRFTVSLATLRSSPLATVVIRSVFPTLPVRWVVEQRVLNGGFQKRAASDGRNSDDANSTFFQAEPLRHLVHLGSAGKETFDRICAHALVQLARRGVERRREPAWSGWRGVDRTRGGDGEKLARRGSHHHKRPTL